MDNNCFKVLVKTERFFLYTLHKNLNIAIAQFIDFLHNNYVYGFDVLELVSIGLYKNKDEELFTCDFSWIKESFKYQVHKNRGPFYGSIYDKICRYNIVNTDFTEEYCVVKKYGEKTQETIAYINTINWGLTINNGCVDKHCLKNMSKSFLTEYENEVLECDKKTSNRDKKRPGPSC